MNVKCEDGVICVNKNSDSLIGYKDQILVTGAGGFIGKRLTAQLLDHGFTKIRCLVRPSSDKRYIEILRRAISEDVRLEYVEGNLLSPEDCLKITSDVHIIYHLAAARGEKSFPDAYLNSVITTRNLLDACVQHGVLKRFVNVSSFAVYSNRHKPRGRVLDECCPIEKHPELVGNAYCFAKAKQEEMVLSYNMNYDLPYVIVRPGVVYGPGNEQIHGRVGIATFGIFLHLGGGNRIPLTFVENCAEAIILAGIVPGIDGEVFNIVDNDLPSSRRFLYLYKKNVRRFRSLYMPHFLSYIFCALWEKYSAWSMRQLPNAFNRKTWHATWKKTVYSNDKLKKRLGWAQKIPTSVGLSQYFESCRKKTNHA
jgi:nucleoside-diphosphate-sugar epimerase